MVAGERQISAPAATRLSYDVSKSSVLVNVLQALAAVILVNLVYFALARWLPPAARHHPFRFDLGIVLDFWFCLVAYGLIRTVRKWK